jgi:lambda family phage portal protein
MNILTSIAEKAFRAAGAKEATRMYAAAKNGRLVGDWTTQNNSANAEIKHSAKILRARSRQLARDNDYFIGYLKKLEANVIGVHGLKLQVDAKNTDGIKKSPLNRKIEDEFKTWCRKNNCDVTAQGSLRDIAALNLRTLATDGEFLNRLVNVDGQLKLQVLDVDWLDEDYNDPKHAKTGNKIVMSVELDQFDRPVAYWLTNPKWTQVQVPGLQLYPSSVDRLRIPAEQIIHRFVRVRAGQVRGVAWAHGAMLTMNQLDGFDEAELVAARIAASAMAFVSPPAQDANTQYGANTTPISTEVAPGQILEVPAGSTIHDFNPTKPQDTDFSKRMLRKVASSLGINYNTMTSDLEGVNFSSIRAGTIEERENWKLIQLFMAEHFYQDVYAVWLMFVAGLVPVTQIKQVMYPKWHARGFDWVDPSKDINADITAINSGIKTRTEVLAERGQDFEETMELIADEKKIIEQLGLEFTSPDTAAKLAADQQAQDAADTKDDGDTKKPKEGKKVKK